MSKQRLSGWQRREGSWEEGVLSWDEQVEGGFLRRRLQQEQTQLLGRLWQPPPDQEEIEAAREGEEPRPAVGQ